MEPWQYNFNPWFFGIGRRGRNKWRIMLGIIVTGKGDEKEVVVMVKGKNKGIYNIQKEF